MYDNLQLRRSAFGNIFLVKRKDWRWTGNDIASLTIEQLDDAAKAIAAGGTFTSPAIGRLLRNVTTTGSQVPESFSQKLKMRSQIKGLITRYGMPAFWMTVNPSDLILYWYSVLLYT